MPLSRRGVVIHGIDLSPAMIAQLQAQPGADAIGMTIGDFAHATVGRTFRLAYLLRNTITNLTTQDEQIDCFSTHLGFEEYDLAAQVAVSHHYWMIDGQLKTFSSPHRYLWPAELDLMARLAGMTLRERWSDWHRMPFTSDSRHHISVWEKTPRSA